MKNIGNLFDSISSRYDRFNHLTSLGIDRLWRRQAVTSLPCSENLLDVASGTADFAIEAARQHKAARIVGIDLSEGMLSVGRRKVQKKNLQHLISLYREDCCALPYDDASFDAVTCGYGVRNFDQLAQGLAEIYRVMKPGAQLRVLEFGYPSNPFIRFFYNLYFTYVMPLVGRLLTSDRGAFRYFTGSVKRFATEVDFSDCLRQAGFRNVSVRRQTFGISMLYSAQK